MTQGTLYVFIVLLMPEDSLLLRGTQDETGLELESGQSFTNAFQLNYGFRERVLTENIFMLHVIKAVYIYK